MEKITEDMESLEMHSAVRNVMRLFDRIKDFEKRVLARQPALSRADSDALIEALTLLAQLLGPFAPHLSEELWIAFGNEADTQTPWPGVSSAGNRMSLPSTASSPPKGAANGRARAPRASSAIAASAHYPLSDTVFACPDCGKGLDVAYDYELAARHFKEIPSSERPQNIWHFEELLPIVDASAQARVGRYSGYTPLIHADRLGAELGL